MTRLVVRVLGTAAVGAALVATGGAQQAPPSSPKVVRTPAPAASPQAPVTPAASHALSPTLSARQQSELINTYCATCHSERAKAGGLSLAGWDAMKAQQQPDVVEKMIRKMSAGLMPPPGAKRPDAPVLSSLTAALETRMDEHAASNPNPGRRTFQRLNRPEYERAIRELLDLDVKASNWLPLDQKSANFDNIADEQSLSPTLLESYLNAAADISRMAVGDKQAAKVVVVYTNPSYVSQHPWDHVEGAPYGTRGGIVVNHVFPADAEYEFELLVISGENTHYEDLDISIDGERVALVKFENGPAAATFARLSRQVKPPPGRGAPTATSRVVPPPFFQGTTSWSAGRMNVLPVTCRRPAGRPGRATPRRPGRSRGSGAAARSPCPGRGRRARGRGAGARWVARRPPGRRR